MVTPEDVAVELGRPTPLDLATMMQWQTWIDRTARLIDRHAVRVGVDPESLDAQVVDDVVLLAVVEHARNPDGVESYDVSVDDAREMRRFRQGSGQIVLTDLWLSWLFPSAATGAFSTQTYGEADDLTSVLDWS